MASLLDHSIGVRTVISNVPDAPGLKLARERGIKCIVDNTVQDICDIIERLSPDLICLAGFMRILPSYITDKYQIMNVHPSLLPRFPGLHAQRQALESGVKYSGCTVHMVDGGVDTGKIIAQKAVPVLPDDTVELLSNRILEQEHVAYLEAVKMFIDRHDADRHDADRHDADRHDADRHDTEQSYSEKLFGDMDEAVRFALTCNEVAYLSNNGVCITVSTNPTTAPPHVVATPGDTVEILHQRLANLVNWN